MQQTSKNAENITSQIFFHFLIIHYFFIDSYWLCKGQDFILNFPLDDKD